mmetsp:Transcript_26970/g.40949  ORF Transcript_26970/g.40949 Transcript_26970/m.40949 type:complete len:127 (+) Transcript_26970:690-1070(+)
MASNNKGKIKKIGKTEKRDAEKPKVKRTEIERIKEKFPSLSSKLLFWIFDMLNFSCSKASCERVQKINSYSNENIPPMFFNENYFTEEEADALVSLKLNHSSKKTLGTLFRAFIDERLRNNNGQVW